MSRYIEYEPLMAELEREVELADDWKTAHEIANVAKYAPSIDIVRCKECRHSFINENHPQKPRICGLTKMCGTTKDDWFCADGEREGE